MRRGRKLGRSGGDLKAQYASLLRHTRCPEQPLKIAIKRTSVMAINAEGQVPKVGMGPGDLILFYDNHFPPDPGSGTKEEPAVYRVAVVVDERRALFLGRGLFGRRVERLPFGLMSTENNVRLRGSPYVEHGDAIANYFKKEIHRPAHFEAGLGALFFNNLQPFITGQLFPTRPIYKTDDEYDAAWFHLKANLRPFDTIFFTNTSHMLSKFIALSTHGPWSHTVIHVNDGVIW